MCKILVISPYVGLKDLFLEVNKELKKDLDIFVGNLYDGLAIARSVEHRHYDAIISRGATAKLLRKHFSIPVLEVQMTGYDILRTLTLLNGYAGKIGMMTYLNKIPGANMIGKLLNMDLTFYPILEEGEIEGEIERASNEGVQVIIGDVISTTTAAKFGIQGILISSGKEAVVETIMNAEQTVYYIQKQKENLKKIEQIFHYIDDGVLVFDEEGQCIFSNDTAGKRFRLVEEAGQLNVGKLSELVPKLSELIEGEDENVKEVYEEFDSSCIRWRKVELPDEGSSDGFALIMKEEKRKLTEQKQEHSAYFHFSSLVARSESMHQLITVAKKISRSDLPVIIYGEPGVGKDSLAQAIHNNSERAQAPYVFINCEAYSEGQLERELFGTSGVNGHKGALETAHKGTIFIDAIGSMPPSIQSKLLLVLISGRMNRFQETESFPVDIRFIAAHRQPLETYLRDGRFRDDFYHVLNGFTLKVPPLRERMDDLDDLIRIFIASCNTTMGKQISGLRETVLNKLKTFQWPGNIRQLKHVIEQMCLMSDGPFIEKKEVQALLHKLREQETEKVRETPGLQLANKTLHEIEQEVILAVLKQEEYNQSKAARRLGINRSTLWRKIKHISE